MRFIRLSMCFRLLAWRLSFCALRFALPPCVGTEYAQADYPIQAPFFGMGLKKLEKAQVECPEISFVATWFVSIISAQLRYTITLD